MFVDQSNVPVYDLRSLKADLLALTDKASVGYFNDSLTEEQWADNLARRLVTAYFELANYNVAILKNRIRDNKFSNRMKLLSEDLRLISLKVQESKELSNFAFFILFIYFVHLWLIPLISEWVS